jgi:hypothetical protein
MMWDRYIRVLVILGMVTVMCSAAGAEGMSIIAETHVTSGAKPSVCTAPCECMAESVAAARWGADGYDRCSKTVCGQSADAMVQYYCFHQAGGTAAIATKAQAQVAVSGTAMAAAPAAAGLTQKSPVNAATILAAIGAALLAVSGLRRK